MCVCGAEVRRTTVMVEGDAHLKNKPPRPLTEGHPMYTVDTLAYKE